MSLESDDQLRSTEHKLQLIERQIQKAKARPHSLENVQSIQSLVQMANQMREEVIVYRARRKRQAS